MFPSKAVQVTGLDHAEVVFRAHVDLCAFGLIDVLWIRETASVILPLKFSHF